MTDHQSIASAVGEIDELKRKNAALTHELIVVVEDRDGCRFETRTLAADLHTMAKQNVDLTGRLKDWTEKAQGFEDDALAAGVEAEEARDERDYYRDEFEALKQQFAFETEQHTARIAELENQLAQARNQRDNMVTTKPGLA